MQSKIRYLSDLKFNLETWKRELRFHFNEMDTFQENLEEIAQHDNLDPIASKKLENFQNRIMIEKDAIGKLRHRIRNKMVLINRADLAEDIDGRLGKEQHSLKEDMRTYIRMHYDLKEEMMDFFAEYLVEA